MIEGCIDLDAQWSLQDRVNCAGSAALGELVCGLRVLLVFTSANEVMFSSTVVWQQDYAKTTPPIITKSRRKGDTWATEVTKRFWW